MGNPFIYPKVAHIRTQTPPIYTDYKKYKPILQLEFGRQCVYCRAMDNKGYETFGVDHYRPKKHFPTLENEYLNLYYSCNRCNSLKGSYWPTPKQRKLRQFIPNPCENIMFDHLRYRVGNVISMSEAGELTLDLLDLNDPIAVRFREGLIGAIEQISSLLKISTRTIKEIQVRLANASNSSQAGSMTIELNKAKSNLDMLQNILDKLLGKAPLC